MAPSVIQLQTKIKKQFWRRFDRGSVFGFGTRQPPVCASEDAVGAVIAHEALCPGCRLLLILSHYRLMIVSATEQSAFIISYLLGRCADPRDASSGCCRVKDFMIELCVRVAFLTHTTHTQSWNYSRSNWHQVLMHHGGKASTRVQTRKRIVPVTVILGLCACLSLHAMRQ